MSPELSLRAIEKFAHNHAPELFNTAASLIVATCVTHVTLTNSGEPSLAQVAQTNTEDSMPSCQEPLYGSSAEQNIFIGSAKDVGVACDEDKNPSHKAPSGTIFPQSDLMM